jgi:hypothetical protein
MAVVAQASRRSYAMAAEDTNKGVVVLTAGQEDIHSMLTCYPGPK